MTLIERNEKGEEESVEGRGGVGSWSEWLEWVDSALKGSGWSAGFRMYRDL